MSNKITKDKSSLIIILLGSLISIGLIAASVYATSLGSSIVVTNNASIGNNLTVSGSSTIGTNLTIGNNLTVSGSANLATTTLSKILTISSGGASITGPLTLTGDSTLTGGLTLTGLLTQSGGNVSLATTTISGRLGIGTTSPRTKLGIVGDIYLLPGANRSIIIPNIDGASQDGNNLTIAANGPSAKSETAHLGGNLILNAGNGNSVGDAGGDVIITAGKNLYGDYYNGDIKLRGGATPSTYLFIKGDNGNVGVGTTVPKNKLDVKGSMVIGSSYSGTSIAPTNGLLVEGSVGIGTSTPQATLDVQETASSTIKIGDTSKTGCIELGNGANLYYIYVDGGGNLVTTTTKPSICQ